MLLVFLTPILDYLSEKYIFPVSDLVSQNIEVILNRKTCMEAVVKIIEENIPEVMSSHTHTCNALHP